MMIDGSRAGYIMNETSFYAIVKESSACAIFEVSYSWVINRTIFCLKKPIILSPATLLNGCGV
jgi:hypothetical protein